MCATSICLRVAQTRRIKSEIFGCVYFMRHSVCLGDGMWNSILLWNPSEREREYFAYLAWTNELNAAVRC